MADDDLFGGLLFRIPAHWPVVPVFVCEKVAVVRGVAWEGDNGQEILIADLVTVERGTVDDQGAGSRGGAQIP